MSFLFLVFITEKSSSPIDTRFETQWIMDLTLYPSQLSGGSWVRTLPNRFFVDPVFVLYSGTSCGFESHYLQKIHSLNPDFVSEFMDFSSAIN